MPLLVYDYPDFTPNTVIASAKVNAKFTDIATLLNVTGLDDTNIQAAGITRATKLKAGNPNYVVINDSSGKVSEEAALAPARGGVGISMTLSSSVAGNVPQVNSAGTAFVLAPAPSAPAARVYQYLN